MTSVQSHSRLCRKHLFIVPPDSSPSPKSKFSEQPARPQELKSLTATIDVFKYSEDNLQQIFKTVLEVHALAPALAPAPTLAASEEPRDKLLKARSPDVYCKKPHIDCYNFC